MMREQSNILRGCEKKMFEKMKFKFQRLFSDRRLGAERVLMFGEYLGDPHTVAVDTNGNIVSVMKGLEGSTLRTIAVDSSGKLISVMQGSQGINIAQQAATGELKSVMQGLEGSTLRTVAVDSSGNIVAVIKGDYNDTLQTIKLDSEHRMVARALPSVDAVIHKSTT